VALGVFVGLALALAVGVAPNFSTRVVGIGERVWPGYAQDLRADPVAPECELAALEERVAACPAEAAPTASGADPFGGADPFADPGSDPAAAEPTDPFGGSDPFAGSDPFVGATPKATENCTAVRSLRDRCAGRHAAYADIQGRLTSGVRGFRSVELAVSDLARFAYWKHLLVILVMLGAARTTALRMHIALRSPLTRLEHWLAQGSQAAAHLLLMISCVVDWRVQQQSSAEAENPMLPLLWAVGFGCLLLINGRHLARPPPPEPALVRPTRLLMVVPLYVYMALIGAGWFLLGEGHTSGQAIYLHKFAQHPKIYLGIGLYIWAGMMLSETRVATLFFGLLTPWKLPPAVLAWLVVVLAALPTAYSGASGIFVIAAGAVIFHQLRAAGASPRMALSATAMSGSLGVVLRPCLVVVLIAVLNKQVTTDELFSNGLIVFGLTTTLYLAAMLLRNDQPLRVAPVGEALPQMIRACRPLLPYVGVAAGMLVLYAVVFDTEVNEHTAAFVLPAILIALVIADGGEGPQRARIWRSLTSATEESSHHIGALLMLMACSVGLGGVVERAELMELMPSDLGSPVAAMSVLVVIMVLVGMTMDALGAVILVSFTVAGLAYDNGIDPVHFWMMVLVAFELGYLTPPVAINHLLARQVIGAPARVEETPTEGGFLYRYEHVLLPMAVMGTALLLVAFVPLFWG